jgi:hypothetical protein
MDRERFLFDVEIEFAIGIRLDPLPVFLLHDVPF